MSTAKNNYSGTGTGTGTGNISLEKSSFTKTFNRLSSFIKEKGSLRELGINSNFDVIGKPEISHPATPTVDLLSNMENSVQKSTKPEKLINLPQFVSLDCLSGEPNAHTETKTAQMTIFYEGKVMVFDNISCDKAKDLMLVASGASNYNNQIQNQDQFVSTSNSPYEGFKSQENIISGLQVNGSGLPIARRVSLHKFLAKRKDRTNVRASSPYELHNPLTVESSSKYKFDLNL